MPASTDHLSHPSQNLCIESGSATVQGTMSGSTERSTPPGFSALTMRSKAFRAGVRW